MYGGSGAGTGGPEVYEQPEDGEDSAAGSGSEADPHESADAGPDAGASEAEPPAATADDAEPEPEAEPEAEPATSTREPDAEDGVAALDGETSVATAGGGREGAAEPAATTAIEVDPPASTYGPRFVPPRYDPASLPPAEPFEPTEQVETVEPADSGAPVDVTPEPVEQSPAVRPQVPRQYATGGVPIVEIEGGWDAVHRRRHRQTVTFIAGFFLVLVLGCLAWLTYAGVVPWPFGGAVTVAQNVCRHSQPLAPKKVSVRVFNGSGRDGLARQVSAQLKALGFVVKVTGNDPLESKIKTQVEVRHGESGDLAAATMSAYVVGKTKEVQDDRQDSSIDLVLGPSFSRLHSKSELKKSLAAVTATLPMTCPPGVTPPASVTPTASVTPKARMTPRRTATPKR